MEWQPIETAPSDTVVELGWWDKDANGNNKWRTEFGVAFESHPFFFGLFKVRLRKVWYTERSHWRNTPEPPN